MGIQISEDKLSPRARAALGNAKNKSQFLRDAIEFYVGRDTDCSISDISDLSKDIKDIKKMLADIAKASIDLGSLSETAAANIEKAPEISTTYKASKQHISEQNTIEDKPESKSNAGLSEKEKEALKLLDESIGLFST